MQCKVSAKSRPHRDIRRIPATFLPSIAAAGKTSPSRRGIATCLVAEPLPYELVDLIQRCLPSMDHVELVVLVFAKDEQTVWTVEEAAREVRSTPEVTRPRLHDLVTGGLLACEPSARGDLYRFAPRSAALRRAAVDLRAMYSSRPVTLVRAIYERPPSAVRSFADAFLLRGKDKER